MPKQNSQGDFMNYSELHYILCIAKHQNLTGNRTVPAAKSF